ncbi:hypothetical protein KAFR_0B02000 [Kazachstania africana CBS 2517]|uniref:C2H2-type domain-containing protein n=1 Tax=Kazachstania africana (strain ATCC 22294 / BCRC 22015 / CBS 2517 / CECT 1963 / NBRC 1671 / NRRL Y-8276) TaxID=1071382 RepID=H2AQ48_KAZAF|nr:hypothetical protein KAFR_0B02000 [Kazachstania africana CBS 2517]CCF56498.1 hypothetical protein KAFR_0B02000 [Kazachstania africana CBS 2517]
MSYPRATCLNINDETVYPNQSFPSCTPIDNAKLVLHKILPPSTPYIKPSTSSIIQNIIRNNENSDIPKVKLPSFNEMVARTPEYFQAQYVHHFQSPNKVITHPTEIPHTVPSYYPSPVGSTASTPLGNTYSSPSGESPKRQQLLQSYYFAAPLQLREISNQPICTTPLLPLTDTSSSAPSSNSSSRKNSNDISRASSTTSLPSQKQLNDGYIIGSGMPLQKHLSREIRQRKKCPVCGKMCSRPSTLKTHYLIHTGDTPFKCTWSGCPKAFNVKSNMLRHVKSHEKKLSKKLQTKIVKAGKDLI